jgi:nicotinamide-nucleotide amidase
MRIEILCTGDEILTGKTINTNYSHMARRLVEVGLDPYWGTTVGDDRAALLAAFRQAAERADAVIVDGGLGPTVDDLSQEIAAEAAGVTLVLHEPWLARMEAFYARRNRPMPVTNRKQAMLPEGAEFIDNPIGTACGFAVTIGKARFYFTPGVPRELRRMLEEQILPRLLERAGLKHVTRLKRFHSFGIGESRADELLTGLEAMGMGQVKLGFQSHYPQLETKLSVRGADDAEVERILSPLIATVRERYGNFILCEDDSTLEGTLLGALRAAGGTLAVAETLTGGAIAARLAPLKEAAGLFRRGVAGADAGALAEALGSDATPTAIAAALRTQSGASHALAVTVTLEEAAEERESAGIVGIGIADAAGTAGREARLWGGREWVRLGAMELSLDCLRRRLLGLPVDERVDFERR